MSLGGYDGIDGGVDCRGATEPCAWNLCWCSGQLVTLPVSLGGYST